MSTTHLHSLQGIPEGSARPDSITASAGPCSGEESGKGQGREAEDHVFSSQVLEYDYYWAYGSQCTKTTRTRTTPTLGRWGTSTLSTSHPTTTRCIAGVHRGGPSLCLSLG